MISCNLLAKAGAVCQPDPPAVEHLSQSLVGAETKRQALPNASTDSRTHVVERQRASDRRMRPPEWVTTSVQRHRLLDILKTYQSANTASQRARLLKALRGGPCTTFELRDLLDIAQVGARLDELKKRGYKFSRVMVAQPGTLGEMHVIACYSLICEVAE